MEPFFPYCQTFPVGAVGYVVPILRGKWPGDRNLAINAVYTLLSYGLGQGFPLTGSTAETVAEHEVHPADIADYLEHAAKVNSMTRAQRKIYEAGNANSPTIKALPWNVIIPALFELFGRLLLNRRPPETPAPAPKAEDVPPAPTSAPEVVSPPKGKKK